MMEAAEARRARGGEDGGSHSRGYAIVEACASASGRGDWNNLGQWGIFGTRSMVLDADDKYVCAHTRLSPPAIASSTRHATACTRPVKQPSASPHPIVGADVTSHPMVCRRMLFSLAVESIQPPGSSCLPGSPEMGEPSASSRGPLRFEINQELRLGVAMLTMEEDEVSRCALGPCSLSFCTDCYTHD